MICFTRIFLFKHCRKFKILIILKRKRNLQDLKIPKHLKNIKNLKVTLSGWGGQKDNPAEGNWSSRRKQIRYWIWTFRK